MWHWGGNFSPHFVWVRGLGLTQAYVSGFLLFWTQRTLGYWVWGPSGTLLKEQGSYNLVQNMGHKGPVLWSRWVGSEGARTPMVFYSILLWYTFTYIGWIVLILSILICINVVLYWRPWRDLVYMYHELFMWLYKWASCDLNILAESSVGSYVYYIMMYTLPSLSRENVNGFCIIFVVGFLAM
jgi:hypothetical protein